MIRVAIFAEAMIHWGDGVGRQSSACKWKGQPSLTLGKDL
jgi:hypothetical protein